MMEFTFEPAGSPWELALARLNPGDTLSARRFLTLLRAGDKAPEEAALELEEKGVMLDVSDLPAYHGNPDTANRLELERKLLAQGGWSDTLDPRDPLRLFVEELALAQPVTGADALAAKAAAGDQKAARALTDGYLKVVFDCAKEFSGRGVLLMDLIQEGSLGLWQAVLSYETGSFDSHARWWIRQAMARAVTLQADSDGVGEHLAGHLERYQEAERLLCKELGRSPLDEELALELGVTPEETRSLGKMLGDVREIAKLKAQTQPQQTSEEDDLAVEDTAYYQTRERVSDLMSALTERETLLLDLRYGLKGKAPLSVQEVAVKLNMTAAEVAELEARALAKMRGAQ